ncbi:PP2C family protein-serine/threonine phosphatase [Actinocrispum wychmicini]|uniref:Protein phosphatase n=1 Tax=Actinocrispum wychmicini TaxID=1213861 RepID=A0A4R2IZC1_9PSEU|nr:PP2C family serine/threonine-protein phosphatase [Actinocrispum wychmicini]TCO50657.1 protein phosphatase [Actinocrispum wychmicini]
MIRCAVRTKTGVLHDENQDRVATDVERGMFLVVDGMGGLADAAATAQIVVDRFPPLFARVPALTGPDVMDVVTGFTAELNAAVRDGARSGPDTTGAAVASLLVRDGWALAVHLGDSRIYLSRNGKLARLTDDHTDDGHLTRFMGMPGEVFPGVSVHELVVGDRILLCTDGLTNSVDDRAVGAMLSSENLEHACQRLVDAAVDGGAIDDVTVVALEWGHG